MKNQFKKIIESNKFSYIIQTLIIFSVLSFSIETLPHVNPKLKLFLSNNIAGFDIELLVKIIPSCLVELLPIYQKISSKLSINEIHTWVMDIYKCRLLLINCLFNQDIKVIGCQLFVLLQKIKCLVDFGSYRFPFLEFDICTIKC